MKKIFLLTGFACAAAAAIPAFAQSTLPAEKMTRKKLETEEAKTLHAVMARQRARLGDIQDAFLVGSADVIEQSAIEMAADMDEMPKLAPTDTAGAEAWAAMSAIAIEAASLRREMAAKNHRAAYEHYFNIQSQCVRCHQATRYWGKFEEPAAAPAKGSAHISGTAKGSSLSGHLTLTETPEGLKVSATFQNAPPGKHGFHIHENGSCGDGGKEAGGHYNPAGAPHGLLSKDGFEHAHAGDFGNVEIAADGAGTHEALLPGLTLRRGKFPVAGKAVILHEKEDDFSQPTGNAGGRIGCGVIGG